MNAKLAVLFFIFSMLWTNKRCSVFGYIRHIRKPTLYRWNEKIRSRVSDEPTVRQYTDCGGKVTKGPGTIEQFFVARQAMRNVHCTWRIHAPKDHNVYVKQLRITRTTLRNAEFNGFDDAPMVQIFDGHSTDEDDRLFRLGDATMNRCLSSGQELTVDLQYNESGKHIDQEAVIKYGFIETSKVEDLLP